MGNSLNFRAQQNNRSVSNTNITNLPSSRLNLIFNNLHGNNNDNKRKKGLHLNNVSFASHFIIAGRRFKNLLSQTQTFLFGDQLDLSFILAHKPVLFPYETPEVEKPSKYLQSLVNIRKDTIKLVKLNSDETSDESFKYNIEFRFDCDCDVRIRIIYFATERLSMVNNSDICVYQKQLSYLCGCTAVSKLAKSSGNNLASCICLNDSFVYAKGANILFQNPDHFISPGKFDFKNWQFNIHSNYYPIAIECTPVSDSMSHRHAHVTLAYIDKSHSTVNSVSPISLVTSSDEKNLDTSANSKQNNPQIVTQSNYVVKPIKQKQFIDGVLFSLQEIYGIEKKISPDYESSQVQNSISSVSESNTSSSIVTQNSMLTSSKSSRVDYDEDLGSMRHSILLNHNNNNNNNSDEASDSIIEKKRRIEQDIEQELKGIECVICMCETRDTLILPCRHLCLCKLCAINLRVQSNNCPICRIPFIALLQLKLLKRKESSVPSLPKINLENNLPIVKMENLPIVRIQELKGSSLDISHENVIIEENFDLQVEPDEKFQYMNELNSNKKSLRGLFEVVSIYEAFNNSNNDQQNLKSTTNNDPKVANKSKRFKIKILDPIRSSSDFFVQNVNETTTPSDKTSSENTIPKLFEIQNISNQIESSKLDPQSRKLENDLRCSSVVLNKTITESPEKIYRSSSFIGNFRQMNKHSENIQMDVVVNSDNAS